MVPQVGDIVLVIVDPTVNNGSDIAPGVLTAATAGQQLGESGRLYYRVNAKVFVDADWPDQWLTSAALYGSEDAARAAAAARPGSRALFPKTTEVR